MSNLILYHYFGGEGGRYRENLEHFMRFAINPVDQYIFIMCEASSIKRLNLPNIRYVDAQNLNNDYGGYCQVIGAIDLKPFDFVFFVNCSVMGPFVHPYCNKPWTNFFTEQFSSDTGMVGSTINILPPESPFYHLGKWPFSGYLSHVQTTAYSLRSATVERLRQDGFFNCTRMLSKDEVVFNYEIRLSCIIKNYGMNLRCLLPEYNHIDYRLAHAEINSTAIYGDVNFTCAYFGRTIHPYESLFVKSNRGIYSSQFLSSIVGSMKAAIEK